MNQLQLRVITAVALIPAITFAVLKLTPELLLLVSVPFLLLAIWEWTRLAGYKSTNKRIVVAIIMLLLMYLSTLLPIQYIFCSAALFWVGATLAVFNFLKVKSLFSYRAINILFGVIIIAPAWFGLIWLRNLNNGATLVLFLFFIIWAADIGAYFTGKKFGKHKLASDISPGKTWEGVLGAILFGFVVAGCFSPFLSFKGFGLEGVFVAVLLIVPFSIIGDLTESIFKRVQGMKDSGSIIPGHGGVLDRIDSLLAAIPILAFSYQLIM